MPTDIYSDLCGDNREEHGVEGSWNNPASVGSCNACSGKDTRSNSWEQVFVLRIRSLEVRLCQAHLRELVKISRYKL